MLLAGGGAMNATLCKRIEELVQRPVFNTDVASKVHISARESVAMAVLAAMAWDGFAITLTKVTKREAVHNRDGLWCLPAPNATEETQS